MKLSERVLRNIFSEFSQKYLKKTEACFQHRIKIKKVNCEFS